MDFSFSAPIDYLEKGSKHDIEKGVIDVRIGGVISDESIDQDGEVLVQSGLDFDYFKKHGRIKYEHSKNPADFIGFPEGIIRKGTKTEMVGRIFAKKGTPQYNRALECIGDLENIIAYNAQHPNNPRSSYYSIEGIPQKKDGSKVVKGLITNVVITANPKNSGTYVTMMKGIMAGSDVDIQNLTGGQAGRIQHLQNHKGDFKMFKSKEEVKKFYLEKGLTEAEATAKADAWESTKTSRDSIASLYKGLSDDIDTAVADLEKSIKTSSANTDTFQKSFGNAMTPIAGTTNIDPIAFLKVIADSNLEMLKGLDANKADILKGITGILGVTKKSLELNKSLSEQLNVVQDFYIQLADDNEELRKSIAKYESGFTTAALNSHNIMEEYEPKNFKSKDEVKDFFMKKGIDEVAAMAKAGDWENWKAKEDEKKPKYAPLQVKNAFEKAIKGGSNEDGDGGSPLMKSFITAEMAGFNWNLIPSHIQAMLEPELSK